MKFSLYSRLVILPLGLCMMILVMVSNASAEWKESVLYSFQGGTDGATPAGGVVFDKAGNLYGTTTDGASDSCRSLFACGTVFQLAPPVKKGDPWTETVLYVFQGAPVGDGASPFGGLVIDSAGNLYGTTGYGGIGTCLASGTDVGCGTVFELSPPAQKGGAWTETVLYSFQGNTDGQLPLGNLVFDLKGNLYGATEYGGGYGSCNAPYDQHCGTAFELSPPAQKGGAWTETLLYSFRGSASKDGANPNGGLIFDSKGAIYGTTQFGGNLEQGCRLDQGEGCGTVFTLKPPAKKGGTWAERILYRFKSDPDAGEPVAGLVFDTSGNLYGTTLGGGKTGLGTIFQLKRGIGSRWIETVLYRFDDGKAGAYPMAGLIFDSSGDIYGTVSGGHQFRGDFFRMKPPGRKGGGWSLTVLYGFTGSPDAAHPAASLLPDQAGNLYGTTQWGGTGQSCQGGCGTLVEVSP
jgi:uncharacterized repeat protein (TIGR03803 family)